MMMFARLKHQPLEPIQWLLMLNITIAVLVAIQVWALSPVMTGFSILAAASAAIVLYLLNIEPARKRQDGPVAAKDRALHPQAANAPLAPKADERVENAGLHPATKPSTEDEARSEQKAALSRLEEALRRLANGDASSLLHAEFPQNLDGLRFHFNRLASTLQVNLLPTSRAAVELRENAYRAQSNLALFSGRIEKMQEATRAVSDATGLIRTTLRNSEADMRVLTRTLEDMQNRSEKANALVLEIGAHHNTAQAIRLRLDALSRKTADLAVAAEQFVSAPELHRDTIRRNHAGECVDIARTLMQACHEMATTLEAGSRGIAQLRHEQNYLADSLAEQAEPSARLTNNLEQELQRVAVAQTLAREIAAVTTRLCVMADGVESQMMKVMSETTTIETRLSLFNARPANRAGGEKSTAASHLRCVT